MSHLKNKPPSERKQAQIFLDQELSDDEERGLLERHLIKILLLQPEGSISPSTLMPILKKLVGMMQLEDPRYRWVTFGRLGMEQTRFKALPGGWQFKAHWSLLVEGSHVPMIKVARFWPLGGFGLADGAGQLWKPAHPIARARLHQWIHDEA